MTGMKEFRFKDIGTAEPEAVACYIKKFTPSFYMGMHSHVSVEMMYASKGNFSLEIMRKAGGEGIGEIFKVTVHQGELVFLDVGVFHRLLIDEDEVTIYNVELALRAPVKEASYRVNGVLPVNYAALIEMTALKSLADAPDGYKIVPNLSQIDSSFRRLIFTVMKPSTCLEDACCARARILLFFMEIARSLTLLEKNDAHYVKKVQLYIKHHYHLKITLDDIAKAVGYHKSYISAQYKNYTGKTIVQTINELRISKSLRLLRDTSLPIAEIARQVGFPSYAQMVHAFHQTVQMSPSACRKVFLNDEMDYDDPQYSSISIRINEEDFLLDDEEFSNAYYKKDVTGKSKKLLNY